MWFEDVQVGHILPPMTREPTTVQLFRFSAVTWNAHRIHYDRAAAESEGHPDVLVQAHLHGAFLAQFVQDWAGPGARLVACGWSNRGRATPGDLLEFSATVAAKRSEGERGFVDLDVRETNDRGELCLQGTATVSLPSRGA